MHFKNSLLHPFAADRRGGPHIPPMFYFGLPISLTLYLSARCSVKAPNWSAYPASDTVASILLRYFGTTIARQPGACCIPNIRFELHQWKPLLFRLKSRVGRLLARINKTDAPSAGNFDINSLS